jgi:hypothetical protein
LPALAILITLSAPPAGAGTVTGGAGFDYQSGPRAQSYRSTLLFASGERGASDLTLAALRYGDSGVGPGIGAFANAGVAVTPHARVRAIGLRAIGDGAYRATRWRLGPEFHTASDVTLGAYYLRLTDNAGGSFGSAGVEVGGPIGQGVTGQIGSSYGRWNGDATTAQAALSGTWHPVSRVLLLGELDVGRNLTTTTTAGPSGGGALGGLPLPGGMGRGRSGSGETRSSSDITAAGQIGIRFLIR